uniref:Secreted protein n=1 Tax=Knipowitschia caucasica TaxID=637954 RepID=A0AAV2L5L4_KNICA
MTCSRVALLLIWSPLDKAVYRKVECKQEKQNRARSFPHYPRASLPRGLRHYPLTYVLCSALRTSVCVVTVCGCVAL